MTQGKYPFPFKNDVVPGSDGAGTVEAVGSRVTRFKPGGKPNPLRTHVDAFAYFIP
jgi:NADPH:quinone reductase-like Zn-dependent oxidoreductase